MIEEDEHCEKSNIKECQSASISSPSSSSCSSNSSSLDKTSTGDSSKLKQERKLRKSTNGKSSRESCRKNCDPDTLINEDSPSKTAPLDTIDRHLRDLDQQIHDLAYESKKLESQNISVYKVASNDIKLINNNNRINNLYGNKEAFPRPSNRPPMNLPSMTGTDSDHIYESIPDITESDEQEEPIYCLPYEPGKTGRLISPKCSVQQTNLINQNNTNLLSPKQCHIECNSLNNTNIKNDPRGTRSSKSSSSSAETGSRGSKKGCSDRKRSSFKDTKPRSSDRDVESDRKQSVEQWVEQNTSITQGCNCRDENRDSSSAYNTGESNGSNHQVS